MRAGIIDKGLVVGYYFPLWSTLTLKKGCSRF